MTCKPLWNKHLARDTGLMQLNSRGRELLRGLDEITSVRPKTGAILCDDKVTLPSVAGKPCHLMPARGGIFTVVRIIPRHYDGIPTFERIIARTASILSLNMLIRGIGYINEYD